MFEPKKFVELARKILSQRNLDKDARIRSSISRSYYGPFLYSKNILEEKFDVTFLDMDQIHKDVIENLKSKKTKLGYKLETLNEFREDADLKTETEQEISDATHCLGIAKNLMDDLNKF